MAGDRRRRGRGIDGPPGAATWLGIDQGGHSTRAAAFDDHGRIVALAQAPLATRRRAPCFVEHDPSDMRRSVDACITDVAAQLGRAAAGLRSAGLATQRSTMVCASRRTGEALTPLISWQDRRGGQDLARFESAAGRIKEITGLRLSPHYGVGKLRWCLQRVDAVRAHCRDGDLVAAPLSSYLAHHLCGGARWSVDPVNASRTLLMDMRAAKWSAALLQLFELDEGLLPRIEPCRAPFGEIDVGGYSVPLEVVTGDQAAALYCAGEPEAGTAFVNIGTGAFVQAVVGGAPVVDPRLLSSIVWHDGRSARYVLEGTVNGAAAAIDDVSDGLGLRLDPAGSELARAFRSIDAAPFFLNGVAGLGSPDWVADFPSRFVGGGTPAQRIAAVYESVVFLIVRNLEQMRRRTLLSRITVTGGLARSDWLAQYLADASGIRLLRAAEPQATLTGLAHLVSGGRSRAAAGGRVFEPQPNPLAERRYRDWSSALDAALTD